MLVWPAFFNHNYHQIASLEDKRWPKPCAKNLHFLDIARFVLWLSFSGLRGSRASGSVEGSVLEYLVSVEGYEQAEGDFRLDVTCGNGNIRLLVGLWSCCASTCCVLVFCKLSKKFSSRDIPQWPPSKWYCRKRQSIIKIVSFHIGWIEAQHDGFYFNLSQELNLHKTGDISLYTTSGPCMCSEAVFPTVIDNDGAFRRNFTRISGYSLLNIFYLRLGRATKRLCMSTTQCLSLQSVGKQ